MNMEAEVLKIIDIVTFAARLEREAIPITLEERALLIQSTYEFAEKIKPLYEKYGQNKGE